MNKIKNYILVNGSYIAPKTLTKYFYKKVLHKKINLKNPKTLNEKICYLKLNDYNKNELCVKCADKFRVRQYVHEMKCDEILNEIYGIYDDADEIDFDKLPNEFVLKLNHGSGMNIICLDKTKLNISETKKILNNWKKQKYGYQSMELHYTKIKPKIICEKLLKYANGEEVKNYEIYCFNGVAKICRVFTKVDSGKYHFSLFDKDWKTVNYYKEEYTSRERIEKPKNFDKMIYYAEKLSKPFKFVRVDFYYIDDKIILSEMTFTPGAGFSKYYTEEGDEKLGNMLKI